MNLASSPRRSLRLKIANEQRVEEEASVDTTRGDMNSENPRNETSLKLGDGEWNWSDVLPMACSMKDLVSKTDITFISDHTTITPLLHAVSIAYPLVVDFINQAKLPLDVLLSAGRQARESLGCEMNHYDKIDKRNSILATCHPLLSQSSKAKITECLLSQTCFHVASPMIVGIKDAYSFDFKERYMSVLDDLLYTDCDSGSNGSNLRASFLRESGTFNDDNPLIKLGEHAIISVPADKNESVLFHLHTEITNMFQDTTREVLRYLCDVKNPPGYISCLDHYRLAVKAIVDGVPPPLRDQKMTIHDIVIAKTTPKCEEKQSFHKLQSTELDQARRFTCNAQIIKVGTDATYGPHKDSSFVLNSPSHKQPHYLENGSILPTQEEMMVTTTVLCAESNRDVTILRHINKATAEVLSRIETGKRHVTIQSPLAQGFHYCHASESSPPHSTGLWKSPKVPVIVQKFGDFGHTTKPGAEVNGVITFGAPVRCVITSRQVPDPIKEMETYRRGLVLDRLSPEFVNKQMVYSDYDITGVFSGRKKSRSPVYTTLPKSWNLAKGGWDTAISNDNLDPIMKPPYYRALSQEVYDKFHKQNLELKHLQQIRPLEAPQPGIPKLFPLSGFGPRARIALNYRLNEYFLRQNLLICVSKNIESEEGYMPLFTRKNNVPYLPGDIEYSNHTAMKKNRQKHVVDINNPVYIALEQIYKSIPIWIDLWFHFSHEFKIWIASDEINNERFKRKFEVWYGELRNILTSGSGGSCSDPGNRIVGPGTTKASPLFHKSPSSQDYSAKENMLLMWLCQVEAPVLIMFSMKNFLNPDYPRKTSCCDSFSTNICERIHKANCFVNSQIEIYKKEGIDSKKYFVIGYFTIDHYQYIKGKNPTEILDDFSEIPGFVGKNLAYTSFKCEKHYQFEFKPMLSFTSLFEQALHTKMTGGVCERVWVPNDSGKICMPLWEIQAMNDKSFNIEQNRAITKKTQSSKDKFPVQWLGTSAHFNWLCSQPIDVVSKIILTSHEHAYDFSITELIHLMTLLSASNAARSSKNRCTMLEDGDVYGCPLVCTGSEKLPPWLRTTPTPNPNSDYDVVNYFFMVNAKKTIELRKPTFVTLKQQNKYGTYDDIELKFNVDIISELILSSVVLRMTGAVERLIQFSTIEGSKGLFLPLPETMSHFVSYLSKGSSFGYWLSKQHDGLVPNVFKCPKSGLSMFIKFCKLFGSTEIGGGLYSLKLFFLEYGITTTLQRIQLRDFLAKEISQCAPGTHLDSSILFIAHKCISDLEMVFHNFCGETTFDSLGFGPGSKFGMAALTRTKLGVFDPNVHQNRFMFLHDMIHQSLMDLKLEQLFVMGWVREDSKILSKLTGRPYSPSDTEHICCKLYCCAVSADPSRNSGNKKNALKNYCWPLFGNYKWLDCITNHYEEQWKTFLKLPIQDDNMPNVLVWENTYFEEE